MRKKKTLKHQPHNKFKGFLIENRIRQKTVAELLGISPVTLNQKINGTLHFTFDEVEKICDAYDLNPEIFLTQKVTQKQQKERIQETA